MPPANPVVAIRPRSLANVLADLKEAHGDWIDACGAIARNEEDAADRAAEAETREEDLRQEFAERFVEATGLTWKQIETAISEAIL